VKSSKQQKDEGILAHSDCEIKVSSTKGRTIDG
jgi:hypothetical protein